MTRRLQRKRQFLEFDCHHHTDKKVDENYRQIEILIRRTSRLGRTVLPGLLRVWEKWSVFCMVRVNHELYPGPLLNQILLVSMYSPLLASYDTVLKLVVTCELSLLQRSIKVLL
jgi:hypothetical protein